MGYLTEDKICMCDCHRVGMDGFFHCWGLVCCEYEDVKYLITPTRIIDRETASISMREKPTVDLDLYYKNVIQKNK